jgi:REP element-mobilizing transposase RayT
MPNRPPRLAEFSYTGPNRYFVTVCVRSRAPVFANLDVGAFVVQQFLRIAAQHEFEVIAYCVMPDHFHALVQGTRDDAALKGMMHRWKQATGYWWKQRGHTSSLWQEGFFDRIMREKDLTEAVVHYIVANPLRAGLVTDIHDYSLIGSGSYDVDALMAAALDWEPTWRKRV